MGPVTPMPQPERVAIIGAGVIGAAWAARWMLCGSDALVYDPGPETERIVSEVAENARHSWERMGLASAREGSLTITQSIEEAADEVALVQESVPEDVILKKQVLKQIEKAAPKSALIASSTSGLLPSELQEDMKYPERFLVGHPFNPVYLLPMVEVVAGKKTSPSSVSSAMHLYQTVGMKPLEVRVEIDAFIADRLLEAVWREALWLVNDGVATTAEIDDVIRFGFGLRWAQMGLFENYRIAGGEGGMKHFIQQFGPSLDWPWSKLTDTPDLSDQLVERIGSQSDAQSGHLTVRELERIRDNNLVDILLALEGNSWGAGEMVSDLRNNLPGASTLQE
ncbi:MAG: 3-hydroxyacyl-CoA dehydrogenase NAD-binding domain-containing protein [Acidimicrobiales bacterium]|jgi:carnitine 3-dehydrogenase|nr:3-hydroxyacyl-CoA dehydrogenase NAD-binding domain-containing protein [Actinomycetota bacterium]|tara:strand:- start:304 stop:1317 length:1014 start_codon:yes stop_codon:yes gene_type:complete